MKTIKSILIFVTTLLFLGCGSDDDGNNQQSTQNLLTSGKWYFESKSPGSFTACEKKGYVQFMSNGSGIINSFDDSSGTCESLGAFTVTYTLTNNVNLTISAGIETQSAVIESISSDSLTISNSEDGETIEFDKTEG